MWTAPVFGYGCRGSIRLWSCCLMGRSSVSGTLFLKRKSSLNKPCVSGVILASASWSFCSRGESLGLSQVSTGWNPGRYPQGPFFLFLKCLHSFFPTPHLFISDTIYNLLLFTDTIVMFTIFFQWVGDQAVHSVCFFCFPLPAQKRYLFIEIIYLCCWIIHWLVGCHELSVLSRLHPGMYPIVSQGHVPYVVFGLWIREIC